MKLATCQIKYTDTVNAMLTQAIDEPRDEVSPHTHNYRWFDLTDVDLEVLADGLVRLRGTIELYWVWWPIFDSGDHPPEGWPLDTFERHWLNPMRYISGPTYERAIPGSQYVRDVRVDIVVPSSLVTGIPVSEEVPRAAK